MLSLSRTKANFLLSLSSAVATVRAHERFAGLQLWLLRRAGARAGGPVSIGRGVDVQFPHNLQLGRRVAIGSYSRLTCWAPVTIGDDFLSSTGLFIDSGSHDPDTLAPTTQAIHIGHRVWCALRVTICAGVTIGDDVVLGAGAVVVHSIPSGVLAVGAPARPVRPLNRTTDGPGIWSSWRV